MDVINQLLLNMLIIITPVLLYQLFWGDRCHQIGAKINRRIIVILGSLIAVLCMVYPFRFSDGFLYDLRMVPLAACILYAGIVPSLWVAAVMICYRLFLGGSFTALSLSLVLTGILMVLIWRSKPYIVTGSRSRNVTAAAITGLLIGLLPAVSSCITFWWIGEPITMRIVGYFGLYSLITAFTLGMVVYVVEQIKLNSRQRNQSQQADKMNVLSDLAASFAHEIRNPLTVARGFVQIMKQPGIQDDKKALYTNMVLEEIDKAQSIVTDYLSFAKPHLEVIELVDAKQLIQQALSSIEPYAKLCRVDVETQLDDKLIISANRDKFVQCMIHLCKNGIEAMPSGGKLQIIGTVQNRSVCIDIIDHGVGMTPDEIRRLGTPFYSTRDKGTGLGMMVTYRVIQTIHGKIDVTSEVGKGTCFSLLIPTLHATSYH
ncbi:two-component sensor histidine kinase [Paenibacillus sp. H1-7]|uniref:ATP-binding protein n=1 Tax=Paenibacillus sp. H1-7 TaxID=2282849 RepID=UPI001EF8768E|nr:ATP-binding protein [Paenibacillus sp. H1-7]ULL15103.1 two-component sensor histidine kinase [Paenibacillus sp. H1-7]